MTFFTPAGTCMFTQLEAIYLHLGKPDRFDIMTMDAPYAEQMFEATLVNKKEPLSSLFLPRQVPVSNVPNCPTVTENPTVAENPEELLDFLELLLLWSPPKRMTAEEAIRHPFVSAYHNPDDEPRFREPLELPLADDCLFTVNDYRDRIYADVLQIPRAVTRVADKEVELHQQRVADKLLQEEEEADED